MRRALALLAAVLPLALAACSVDVEGAPCTTPGATADCPSGQACGPSRTCSKHVGACVAAQTFCTPGVSQRCAGTRREACVAGDDCGVWTTLDDCGDQELLCHDVGGPPACVCAAPSSEIVVDRAATAGSLVPTGAPEPPGCRFSTLTAALSYARTQPGAPDVVKAVGAPTAADPAVFSAGETFPLRVPSGVTLTTASEPPAPDAWIVSADPQESKNVVELESGATVEGFTFRSLSASGDGLVVACEGATAPASVRGTRIDGGAMVRNGVSVQGTCGLEASDLDVRDAVEAGLLVDVTLADPAVPDVGVTMTGGALSGNGGTGAELRAGFLAISGTGSVPVAISGNHAFGVAALARDTAGGRPHAAVELALEHVDITANWEAGVLLSGTSLPAGAASIRDARVHGNLGKTPLSEHASGRRAAGVLLKGTPVALEFAGNQVFANGSTVPGVVHDQVVAFSTARWVFSGTDCAAGANAFACPARDGYLVYSSALSSAAYAQAGSAYWPVEAWPPDALVFHTSYAPICDPDPSRLPACP